MVNPGRLLVAMRYRRANVEGGTYFFTVNLAKRHLCLLVENVNVLRDAVRAVKQRHPFYIDAFVVLYCQTICTQSGRCRNMTQILQHGGC